MIARPVITVVDNRLPEVAAQLPREVQRAIDKTLLTMEQNVKRGMAASGSPSAPGDYPGIDTGHLVNSIQTERNGMEGVMYTEADYAPWLEFGTSRMAARPFFTPAARVGQEALAAEIDALARQLERG